LKNTFELKVYNDLKNMSESEWDQCNINGNIFTSYNFLKLLQDSNSLSDRTGWYPYYFSWKSKNKTQACIPAYIKSNSQGEFVFDHGWANVYAKLGLEYYPKLVISSPFTPITGKRLLVKDRKDTEIKKVLIEDVKNFCIDKKLSSLHINFIEQNDIKFFTDNNFIVRYGEQFHFTNNNYSDFDDFLSNLSYKKRKTIIKERNQIKKMGLKIKLFQGNDLNNTILEELYKLYLTTINKKWSYDYLSLDFFLNLKKYLKESIVIIAALQESKIVAVALNFVSNNNLYGRYWGSYKDLPFLHFEVCYYKAIEIAIKLKLKKVEAGAQGPHKIKRGYLPCLTYSAHLLFNSELHKLFLKYNEVEKEDVVNQVNNIKEQYSPYKLNPQIKK